MRWNGLPLVIIGYGGISRETYHIVDEINNIAKQKVFDFLGFVSAEESKVGEWVMNEHCVVSSDGSFSSFVSNYREIGVVIPLGLPHVKERIYKGLKNASNIVFPNIVHPNVTFERETVEIGFGNVIASGVRLTNHINIGNFNLINLNCTVGHDTIIENYNVINPLASISGGVKLGNGCLVGTGASVLQNLIIEDYATVGAGAVVTKNVGSKQTVIGIPAKNIER